MGERMTIKITVDRPQSMPNYALYGDAETYDITLTPENEAKFVAGGMLVLELQETKKEIVIRAAVREPETEG